MSSDDLSDEDRDAFLAEMDNITQQLHTAQFRSGFGFEAEWMATTAEIERLDAAGTPRSDPEFVDALRRHHAVMRAELDYQAGVAAMQCPHCPSLRHSEPITVHELPAEESSDYLPSRGDAVEFCFGDDQAAWKRETADYNSGMLAPNDRFVARRDTVRTWRFLPGSMVYAASAASGPLKVPLGRVASVSPGTDDGFIVRLCDREPSRRIARIVNLVTDSTETARIEEAGFDTSLWQVDDDIDSRPSRLDTRLRAEDTRPVHPQFPQLAPASPSRVQNIEPLRVGGRFLVEEDGHHYVEALSARGS